MLLQHRSLDEAAQLQPIRIVLPDKSIKLGFPAVCSCILYVCVCLYEHVCLCVFACANICAYFF